MVGIKEQRQKLGISIKEFAALTRIRHCYLQAIEDEEFEKLPEDVYARGYIKEYARFLGIPCEEVLAAYERYLEEKRPDSDGQAKESGVSRKSQTFWGRDTDVFKQEKTFDVSESPHNQLKKNKEETPVSFILRFANNKTFLYRSLYIMIPVITIVLVYFLLSSWKGDVNSITGVKPDDKIGYQAEYQTEDQAAKTEAFAAPNRNKEENHHLEIIATDTVWLQIVIDDSKVKDILLNPGERVNYSAGKSFSMIIGNAGGVKLKFNDREIDALGDKGQVVRLTFPEKSSYQ
jgi:transcriptional regulator with XRE-family HTH domain